MRILNKFWRGDKQEQMSTLLKPSEEFFVKYTKKIIFREIKEIGHFEQIFWTRQPQKNACLLTRA